MTRDQGEGRPTGADSRLSLFRLAVYVTSPLPPFIRERVNENPWGSGRTPDDKRLQALFPGYFTVINPTDGLMWICVSAPEPAMRNGISMIAPVTYVDDPNPRRIDERALAPLLKYDRERGLSKDAFRDEAKLARKRIAKDKDALERVGRGIRREKSRSMMTDYRVQGRAARPIAPVAVAADLTHG